MKFSTPLSVEKLLNIIGNDVIVKGNLSTMITGINEIHSVEPGDISFVDNAKYYDKVLQSAATVIIINKEVECPEGKVLLISDDPLQTYITIVCHFVKFSPQSTSIHPTSVIGAGTVIQPGAFIGAHVVIGENCIIHANVSIYDHSIIGDRVIIHSGSSIGGDAYYFQKRKEGWKKLESCGRVILSNDVEVGSNCCIDKGVSGDTFIGEGCKLDNLIQVGHDTHVGKHCLIGAHCAIAGCSYIDDECLLWAKACVNKDLYVAKHTTLLALSAIDKSVMEEGTVLFGAPAIDARKKWKEMACSRMLPDMVEEIKELKKQIAELKEKI